MLEGYVGAKFKSDFLKREVPHHPGNRKLIFWCRKVDELGLAPENAGNLSFRTKDGLIITGSGTELGKITEKGLVEVLGYTKDKVKVAGLIDPSSEARLHWDIYKQRKGIVAIYHGHGEVLLVAAERLGIPVTEKEQAYGTMELVKEALKLSGESDFFMLKNHGFVSLGRTMKEAGERMISAYNRAI